jgi:hypothetical protein
VFVLGLGFGGAILQVPWRRLRVWRPGVSPRLGCELEKADHSLEPATTA